MPIPGRSHDNTNRSRVLQDLWDSSEEKKKYRNLKKTKYKRSEHSQKDRKCQKINSEHSRRCIEKHKQYLA
jgi:hypothetical protein